MKLNLTFAEVPMEIGMVCDFAEVVRDHETGLAEQAKEQLWTGLDKDVEEDRHLGSYQENLIEQGIALRFLSSASVIASWAVYEATVSRMARYVRKKEDIALKFSDLRGDFLTRAQKYFENVLSTELHPPPFDWEKLREVAAIRHAFAHGNGRLADVQEERRNYLKQRVRATEGVLEQEGYLVVSSEYAFQTARLVDNCLKELINRLAPVLVEDK